MDEKSALETKILSVFIKNGYVPSSIAHKRLTYDIAEHGAEILQLAYKMSPSQLGRMRLLGVRRLSQLKRDDENKFELLMKDMEAMLNE